MDCKRFRKQHLAYLDDTLPGDEMSLAQQHVMRCDGCAAHDTLVRRSLIVARNLPTLVPSEQFQERLRARLAECRTECAQERAYDRGTMSAGHDRSLRASGLRSPRVVIVVAASAMLGVYAWHGWSAPSVPAISMQPVMASQPVLPTPASYVTPELMQAMATGNPVWPAAMLIEDAPTHFVRGDFIHATVSESR
jgi:hypothetical protein